jgi:hypothetical protein
MDERRRTWLRLESAAPVIDNGRSLPIQSPAPNDTVTLQSKLKSNLANPDPPRVILSAFADEAANSKSVVEQFAVLAALGLHYYSPRFLNVSGEVKNIMQLDKSELKSVKTMQDDYGLRVTSIGSPIGKVKLVDRDDGSHNRFVPFARYL